MAGFASKPVQFVVGPGTELRLPHGPERLVRTRGRTPLELWPPQLHSPGHLVSPRHESTINGSRQHLAHFRLPDYSDRAAAARHESDFRVRSVESLPVSLLGRRVAVWSQDHEAIQSEVRRVVRDWVARVQGGPAGHGGLAALLPGAERQSGLHVLQWRAPFAH